jgi:hypothetical protein
MKKITLPPVLSFAVNGVESDGRVWNLVRFMKARPQDTPYRQNFLRASVVAAGLYEEE